MHRAASDRSTVLNAKRSDSDLDLDLDLDLRESDSAILDR